MRLAVAYVRKSSTGEGKQTESFEGQRREIRRYAKATGFRITKWFEEAHSGADAAHRRAFRRMIADACNGKLDVECIICYDLSRFGRFDNDEAGYYRHILRKSGIEVAYVAEDMQGNDSDYLVMSTKQWVAREHSRKLSEYVTRSKLTRALQATNGCHPLSVGGIPPYGYDMAYAGPNGKTYAIIRWMPDRSKEVYDADGNLLRRIPRGVGFPKGSSDYTYLVLSTEERVETVRQMFRWAAYHNMGQGAIARKLNRECSDHKWPPPSNEKLWIPDTIQHILTNERYLGRTVYNRFSKGKFYQISGGKVVTREKPRLTRGQSNARDDWFVVDGAHEPLLGEDLFRRCQEERRKRNRWVPASPHGPTFIFSGMLRCALCGSRFSGLRNGERRGRRPYYACSRYLTYGKTFCLRSTLYQNVLEEAVVGALARELDELRLPPNRASRARGPTQTARKLRERRTRIAAEIEELQASLDHLIEIVTPDNRHTMVDEMAELHRKKDLLVAQLHSLRKRRTEQPPKAVVRVLQVAKGFCDSWANADVVEKRQILSLLVGRIVLYLKNKTARLWWSENVLLTRATQNRGTAQQRSLSCSASGYVDIPVPGWTARWRKRRKAVERR